MPKHRTQLFLEETQYRRLAEMAREQERTISDVVRELVDRGLEDREREKEDKLAALDRLAEIRRSIQERVGVLPADFLAEIRAEREQQRDEVLFDGAAE